MVSKDELIYQLKKQVEITQKTLKLLYARYDLDYEAELKGVAGNVSPTTTVKGERGKP